MCETMRQLELCRVCRPTNVGRGKHPKEPVKPSDGTIGLVAPGLSDEEHKT